MKIRSYQIGAVLPNLPAWKTASTQEAGVSTKTSASFDYTKEYISLLKDMLKEVPGKTLTNEYPLIKRKLAEFIRNPNPQMIPGILEAINYTSNNKKQVETVITKMYEKGAESEFARFGDYVYCMDGSNIQLLTVDQIRKRNKSKNPVAILTNEDLANYRQNSHLLAFDTRSIVSLGQAVGMKQVDEFCQDVIDKIEEVSSETKTKMTKSQLSKELQGLYSKFQEKTPTADQVASFNQLLNIYNNMNEGEGLYDVLVKSDSKRYASESVLKYLLTCMPKNMRDALEVKTGIAGGTPTEYLYNLIITGTKDSNTTHVEKSKEPEGKTAGLHSVEALINGDFSETLDFSITPNTVLKLTGTTGPLFDRHLNAIGNSFLSTILDGTKMGSFIDHSQIYFGSKKINPITASNFLYNGGPQMLADVPVNSSGGVDFKMLENLSKAQTQISEAKDKTPEVIKTIYQKNKVPVKYENDTWVPDLKTDRFFMFHAYTTTKVVNPNDIENPLFFIKPNANEEEEVEEYLKNVFTQANSQYPGGDPLQGVMFMKMAPNAPQQIYSLAGHGSRVTIPSYEQDNVRYNIQQSRQNSNFNAAGLDALK